MPIELDNLVRNFFGIFDNRNGRKLGFAALQAMFVEGALISKRNASSTETSSLADFWYPREALLSTGRLTEFHEWEVASETFVYGGLATRICQYSKQGLLEGRDYAGSGVKLMQFLLTEQGWKITSIVWEDAD